MSSQSSYDDVTIVPGVEDPADVWADVDLQALNPRQVRKLDQAKRVERAYLYFATMPRKSDRRWASRLAMATGEKAESLRRWRKRDQWDVRWAGEVQKNQTSLVSMSQAILFSANARVADRLLDIIDHGSDRDANAAIKTFTEMTGQTVRKPAGVTIAIDQMVDKQLVIDYRSMSQEELFSVVKDAGQENLESSLIARTGRKKLPG